MTDLVAEGLEILVVQATPTAARICARMPRHNRPKSARLSGTLSGPVSPHAATLSTDFPLIDRGTPDLLQAEVTITDPCYWTSDAPFTYELQVMLVEGDTESAQYIKHIGLSAPNVHFTP
jgi:hypothetical protein